MQTEPSAAPQRFSLKELCVRYSLSKTGLYKRLTVAGLPRCGSGRPAFFSVAEVAVLDRLHQHVAQGRCLKSFQPRPAPPVASRLSAADLEELRAALTTLSQRFVDLLMEPESIAYLEALLSELNLLPAEAPVPEESWGVLGHLRVLQKACEDKQPLSSDTVAQLLKVRPQTINRYGSYFEDFNFTYTRLPKSQRNAPVFWVVC